MGLGPPVCMNCERVLDLLTEKEHKKLIDEGTIRPTSYRWWCSKCGGHTYWGDNGTESDDGMDKHLWELSKEQQKKFQKAD